MFCMCRRAKKKQVRVYSRTCFFFDSCCLLCRNRKAGYLFRLTVSLDLDRLIVHTLRINRGVAMCAMMRVGDWYPEQGSGEIGPRKG